MSLLSVISPNFISVIYQCGLRRDLSLLEAGDMTEVGEKGLVLRCVLVLGCPPCVSDVQYCSKWWTEGMSMIESVD